jgi:hypothetical protein
MLLVRPLLAAALLLSALVLAALMLLPALVLATLVLTALLLAAFVLAALLLLARARIGLLAGVLVWVVRHLPSPPTRLENAPIRQRNELKRVRDRIRNYP